LTDLAAQPSPIWPILAPAQAAPTRRSRATEHRLKENPLTRLPFSSLISERDVITRGGDFVQVWRLEAMAFECADEHPDR
jgi:type IV secretion system protein VirB4